MANNRANRLTMDFRSAALNLDRNKVNIKEFNTFNERNAPVYGGALAPYYQKKLTSADSNTPLVDKDGNVWTIDSQRWLCKNGTRIRQITAGRLTKETQADHIIGGHHNETLNADIVCYKSDSMTTVYVKKGDSAPLALSGDYSNNMVFAFIPVRPGGGVAARYAFIAWLPSSGFLRVILIDASSMTELYTIEADALQKKALQYSESKDTLSQSFISAGNIADSGDPETDFHWLGISLFPESGGKVQLGTKVANILVSSAPESYGMSMFVFPRNGSQHTSTLTLGPASDVTDAGMVASLNDAVAGIGACWGFIADGYAGGSVSPYFVGNCDAYSGGLYNTGNGVVPIFAGKLPVKEIVADGTGMKVSITSPKFFYDAAVAASTYVTAGSNTITALTHRGINRVGDTNYATSVALYPGFFHRTAAIWKKNGGTPIVLGVDFLQGGTAKIGNGFSIFGADLPESMTLAYNGLGKTIRMTGSYKILLNENEISGIGIVAYDTLATPWYDIDPKEFPVAFNNTLYYKSVDGFRYKVTIGGIPALKCIFDNRYVIIDTTHSANAYDMKTENWNTWCPDYNNALSFAGIYSLQANTNLTSGQINYGLGMDKPVLVASAINNHFEVSGNPFSGTQWPVQRLYNVWGNPYATNLVPGSIFETVTEGAEIYMSAWDEETTVPKYLENLKGKSIWKDPALQDLYYTYNPDSPVYNPSLFAKYIESYNRQDFVIDGTKGYPLLYSNNNLIMAYAAMSFIENVKIIFVIQGTTYAQVDDYIVRVAFLNGTVSGMEVVTKTTGLVYCGSTLRQAIYYSSVKRTFFAFTGDILLSEICQANSVKILYYAAYIQSVDSIVMSVKEFDDSEYLYFIKNGIFSFKMPFSEVIRVYSGDTDSLFITLKDNSVTEIRLEPESGYERVPVRLRTAFFGTGNEDSNILDCWYFRIHKDGLGAGGKFKVKQNTLTNIGCNAAPTKEIEVTASMFDDVSGVALIRYQAANQAAVGFQLELESDYPVYEIAASFIPDTAQVSAINI